MQNWKSILAMLGLVIIGFAAGFFTQLYITEKKIEMIKKLNTTSGMEERLYDKLGADEVLQNKLQPVVQQHFQKLDAVQSRYRLRKAEIITNLKKDIAPLLTEEQFNKVERYLNWLERKGGNKKNKKNLRKGKKMED